MMKNIFIVLAVIFGLGLIVLALGTLQQDQERAQDSVPADLTPGLTPSVDLPPAGVPAPTVYNLSGTLLAIRGDLLTFGANVERTADGRQLVEERVARVSSDTQIVRFETVTNPETGRARVEERPITLGDLRPGDRIQVISNRDILKQEEIQATKIRFLGRD